MQQTDNLTLKTLEDRTVLGRKDNSSKLPMSVLFKQFSKALQAVVLCSEYGHRKYPEDVDYLNFKRVEGGSETYIDASLRHFCGGEKDEESGLPEVFHRAWNSLAALELYLEENNINIKTFCAEYLQNKK